VVLQTHTSESDWTPIEVASLFKLSPNCCTPTQAPAPAACGTTQAPMIYATSAPVTQAPVTYATAAPITQAPVTYATTAPASYSSGSGSNCAIAWNGNHKQFLLGQCVSFNGQIFAVLQTHTSESDWTPIEVASLFKLSPNCCVSVPSTPASCASTQAPRTYTTTTGTGGR